MTIDPVRISPLIPFLALCAACSAPESWRAVEVSAPFGETWQAFLDVAATNGYHTDETRTDRGLRIYTSRWRESPAPFRQGARTRLHGRIDRPEEAAQGWRIEFRVERQSIADLGAGFEAQDDDWDDDGQDGTREDVILGQLRLRFGQGLGVTPDYDRMRR